MEISVLQSLIDRTSDEITIIEAGIVDQKVLAKISGMKEERVWRKRQAAIWSKHLTKLVKIQKALKKEIAKSIEKATQQRFYDSM